MFKQGLCFPRHGAPHRWGAAVHLQPHPNATTGWEGCKHPPDWSLRPGCLSCSLNYWYLPRVTLHVKNPEGASDISLPSSEETIPAIREGVIHQVPVMPHWTIQLHPKQLSAVSHESWYDKVFPLFFFFLQWLPTQISLSKRFKEWSKALKQWLHYFQMWREILWIGNKISIKV